MILLVDPKYNPNFVKGNLSGNTSLAPGVTISKFMGSRSSPCRLENFPTQNRVQIARNLYLHAEALRMINDDQRAFKDISLVVSEGVYRHYRPGGNGTIPYNAFNPNTASHLANYMATERFPTFNANNPGATFAELKTTGRAIVYQVINKKGQVDLEKTFDVVEFWKDYLNFDHLILEYDTFDPNGTLHAQIILIMPNANYAFDLTFERQISTYYNHSLFAMNELVELKPKLDIRDPIIVTNQSNNVEPAPDSLPAPTIPISDIIQAPTTVDNSTIDAANSNLLLKVEPNYSNLKTKVEAFINREVSEAELNALTRTVLASVSDNALERSYLTTVILNRVKNDRYPNNIIDVVKQEGQFTAVSGTHANGFTPSSDYSRNYNRTTTANVTAGMVEYLKTSNPWLDMVTITGEADENWGYATNVDTGFINRMLQDGGERVANRVFGNI